MSPNEYLSTIWIESFTPQGRVLRWLSRIAMNFGMFFFSALVIFDEYSGKCFLMCRLVHRNNVVKRQRFLTLSPFLPGILRLFLVVSVCVLTARFQDFMWLKCGLFPMWVLSNILSEGEFVFILLLYRSRCDSCSSTCSRRLRRLLVVISFKIWLCLSKNLCGARVSGGAEFLIFEPSVGSKVMYAFNARTMWYNILCESKSSFIVCTLSHANIELAAVGRCPGSLCQTEVKSLLRKIWQPACLLMSSTQMVKVICVDGAVGLDYLEWL